MVSEDWAKKAQEAAGIASGIPTGTIIAWGGLTPPAGYLECAGQILKRDIYKALFKAIGTVWGNTGADNFKLPDFTSAARFLRSRGDGLEVGTTQEDAIRNIEGTFLSGSAIDSSTGVFSRYGPARNGNVVGGPIVSGIEFNPSRVVPTADENRPKNAVVMYCIKAADEYINPAQVDMAKVDQEKVNRDDVKELAGTRLWVSGEYTPILNTPTIVTHGLNIDPLRCRCDVILKCEVAQGGYSKGETIHAGWMSTIGTSADYSPHVYLTSTTIQTNTGSAGLYAFNKTNGSTFAITLANWRYIFRIWH